MGESVPFFATITAVAACAARLAVAIPSRRVGAGNVRLREEQDLAAAIVDDVVDCPLEVTVWSMGLRGCRGSSAVGSCGTL